MNSRAHANSVALLVACAILWSSGGVLIKYIDWPPLAIAGGRALIAAIFLLAVHRPWRFTWSPVQVAAALAYTGCTVPFVVATKLTSAANAIFLQYTAPVWVALLSAWFLREKTSRGDWAAVAVVMAGMALFFHHGLALRGAVGNGLALFTGLSLAGMTLLMRKQKDGSPVEAVIIGNVLGAAIGLPFAFGHPVPSAAGMGALLALGLLQLGLPYLLYSRAIRHVTALQAVLVSVVEPILNPIWVLLFIGERPGRPELAGGAVIVAAVTWRAVFAARSRAT